MTVSDQLLEILGCLFPEQTVDGRTALRDLRWDSLHQLWMISEVDERFGVVLQARDLRSCETVADLLRLIEHEQAAGSR